MVTQKQLEKWLAAVSTVPATGDCTPRMRNEQLIDRLRDLVRSSILMRLLLNSDGRWPLRADPPPPVDQLWTDPEVAGHWRAAWHQGAADLGAPDAARPVICWQAAQVVLTPPDSKANVKASPGSRGRLYAAVQPQPRAPGTCQRNRRA